MILCKIRENKRTSEDQRSFVLVDISFSLYFFLSNSHLLSHCRIYTYQLFIHACPCWHAMPVNPPRSAPPIRFPRRYHPEPRNLDLSGLSLDGSFVCTYCTYIVYPMYIEVFSTPYVLYCTPEWEIEDRRFQRSPARWIGSGN